MTIKLILYRQGARIEKNAKKIYVFCKNIIYFLHFV